MQELSDFEIDALGELMNLGIGRSAQAISNLLEGNLHIYPPEIKTLDFESLSTFLNFDMFYIIKTNFSGDLSGASLVKVNKEDCPLLLKNLLSNIEDEDQSIYLNSILKEVGNIITAGVMGQICNFLKFSLNYLQPSLYDSSMELTGISEDGKYLVCDAPFDIEGYKGKFQIIVTFSDSSIKSLKESIEKRA